MNPQRYQQIYDLFTRLRELPLEARKSILDRACADDAEMRREVEAMLSADAHPLRLESWPGLDVREGLQDETKTELTAATPPQMPQHVGHYSVRRVIATGGMGTVYEAVQEHPHRTVALKVLRGGIASRSALRRFEHESQILGRLRHPNIAQVYEAGMHDDGTHEVPYFAMEYIPNARTLTEYTEQEKPNHRQRLQLFVKICDAVYHGHQKGVIHRDLKPANILIDSAREPKIIDFGVARTTDADMAITTLQTDVGQLIGTLQYMSPEQCAADPHDLDSRSDVYALGVVLYELLCERLPYDITGAPLPEAVRIIREETPARPSTIERRLRGDTETIVLKALAKERDRRYRSAAELADDIKRHLSDEPILARPPSAFYQLRKFARRNKVLVGSVAAILTVLVAAVAVSTTYAIGEARARESAEQSRAAEEQQRKLAEQQAEQLETVTTFQASMLTDMDAKQLGQAIVADQRERVREGLEADEASPERIDAAIASFDELAALINPTDLALKVVDEQVLSRAVRTIDREFADQPLVEAALRRTVAGTYRELGLYPQALSQAERVLALRRRELGDDHPDTLRSIADVGQLLEQMGKLTEAEPYCLEALEGRRRVLGDDDPDTLWSINHLGKLLCSMGKLAEAESYCREALESQRRVLGEGHLYTRESISTMGYVLSLMGKHAEAEPYYREGMEISRGILGEYDPETLIATGNLGELLRLMGRYEEAEPYLRRTLEGFRRVLGGDHPHTLRSANNLGLLLHSMGRLAEAESYYREALEGKRRVWGPDHLDTLTSINNMGGLLQQQGKLSEAEVYFREALEGLRRMRGDDHPSTLMAIHNMGRILRLLGRIEESEALGAEAVRGARAKFPPSHPFRYGAVIEHGQTLAAMQRYAEAEAEHLEAYKDVVETAGHDAPYARKIARSLAELYDAWDKPEQAAEWLAKLPPADRADTLSTRGLNLIEQNRHAEAELALRECLEIRQEVLPEGDWLIFDTKSVLGETLAGQGKFDQAEPLLLDGYAGMEDHTEAPADRKRQALERIVELYDSWGKPDQAAEWRAKLEPAPEP